MAFFGRVGQVRQVRQVRQVGQVRRVRLQLGDRDCVDLRESWLEALPEGTESMSIPKFGASVRTSGENERQSATRTDPRDEIL